MNTTTQPKRPRGRPPKDRSGFIETREAMLRSGMEILTERGYTSTSIDEILRQVGIPKGSFYHYFHSKDAFGRELVQRYSNFIKYKLDKFLSNDALTPTERLMAFIEDASKGMDRYEFKRGCLVGNLGQEVSTLPEQFRDLLETAFDEWQEKIATCLQAAKAARQIRPEVDCKQAAYVFWIGWEGAVLRARLEQNTNALQEFSKFFLDSVMK